MYNSTQTLRDPDGYIVDPEDWTEGLARLLAEEEGLTLDENYWPVLNFMREYWTEHHVAPDVRHVVKYLADAQQFDKKQAKQHLFNLFPYGYVKQACKIAGMQRPRVWSTG
jgi:tRNA 2-thiouridine synthesizing protein E